MHVTVVPTSTMLAISTRPPCNCIMPLAIDRPSPVPSMAFLVASRPRLKASSAWRTSSGGIPGPLSRTYNFMAPSAWRCAPMVMFPPLGVNLTALEMILIAICFTPLVSPKIRGSKAGKLVVIVIFLRAALPSESKIASPTQSVMLTGSSVSSCRPASMREISKISLMRPSRYLPE